MLWATSEDDWSAVASFERGCSLWTMSSPSNSAQTRRWAGQRPVDARSDVGGRKGGESLVRVCPARNKPQIKRHVTLATSFNDLMCHVPSLSKAHEVWPASPKIPHPSSNGPSPALVGGISLFSWLFRVKSWSLSLISNTTRVQGDS